MQTDNITVEWQINWYGDFISQNDFIQENKGYLILPVYSTNRMITIKGIHLKKYCELHEPNPKEMRAFFKFIEWFKKNLRNKNNDTCK